MATHLRIRGYAALFDIQQRVREPDSYAGKPVREWNRPQAFTPALARNDYVRMTINHDDGRILATTLAGSLKLWQDSTGLGFEALTPLSGPGLEVAEAIRKNTVTGCSYAIPSKASREEKFGWDDWGAYREIRWIGELSDVCLCIGAKPAFPQTIEHVRISRVDITPPPASAAPSSSPPNQEHGPRDPGRPILWRPLAEEDCPSWVPFEHRRGAKLLTDARPLVPSF